MKAVTGALCLVLGMGFMNSARADAAKFSCDNDRVRVLVEERSTQVTLATSAGSGEFKFESAAALRPGALAFTGANARASLDLFIRNDHWGRIRMKSAQGRTLTDELIYCEQL